MSEFLLSGKFKDIEHLFTMVPFTPDDLPLEIRLTRVQLPFRLAFAITFNKSQGQTLDRVGLLLREPAFSHGQLYTAFSRVKQMESIRVLIKDIPYRDKRQGKIANFDGVYTQNIVYKEILQMN
jgi:ATP-dependent DNA helicase PIF1